MSGSKKLSTPSPSQAGQAPCGELKLNNRGSISAMENPLTGQAKRLLNTNRPDPSGCSA